MQSKIFIRSLCSAKVDWDQPLDKEFLKSWKSFCCNLEEVSSKFTRRTRRHLFFSKVKASPLKERTLLTLELLAVHLALKCFLTISSNGLMNDVSFSDINLFVGSQVVLFWILTGKAPKKNVFVINA